MLSKAPACINLRGQNETIFALIQTGVRKYSQFKLKGFSTSQLRLKKKRKTPLNLLFDHFKYIATAETVEK